MEYETALTAIQGVSVQPLEECGGERAPLVRQESLDEERACGGHWTAAARAHAAAGYGAREPAHGVRLLRSLLLHALRDAQLLVPRCALAPAPPDPRGWWSYWRETRALERAARRFARSGRRLALRRRAARLPLDRLDVRAFQDVVLELFQECRSVEERAMCVLLFLCDVCERAAREGGFCRAVGWAANHVAGIATPWACRHGGWACVVYRAAGNEDPALRAMAGAAAAALLALAIYCRLRLRVL